MRFRLFLFVFFILFQFNNGLWNRQVNLMSNALFTGVGPNPFVHQSIESGFNAFSANAPRFAQAQNKGFGDHSQGIGMKMLQKFLSADEDDLKDQGAVYDETGNDGLDSTEEIFPEKTEMRYRQRARSAAMVWVKGDDGKQYQGYQAYGCSPDQEKIPNWLSYIVLLMGANGEHKLLKVCVPETPAVISFVIQGGEICKPRIQQYEKIHQKQNDYIVKGEETLMKSRQNHQEPVDQQPAPSVTDVSSEVKANNSKTDDSSDDTTAIQKQIEQLQQKLKQQQEEKERKKKEEEERQALIEKEKQMRFNKVQIDSESTVKSDIPVQDPQVPVLKQQIGDLQTQLSEIKNLLLQTVQNKQQPKDEDNEEHHHHHHHSSDDEETQSTESSSESEEETIQTPPQNQEQLQNVSSQKEEYKNQLLDEKKPQAKQEQQVDHDRSIYDDSEDEDNKELNKSKDHRKTKSQADKEKAEKEKKKQELTMRFKQIDVSSQQPKKKDNAYNFWGYKQ